MIKWIIKKTVDKHQFWSKIWV